VRIFGGRACDRLRELVPLWLAGGVGAVMAVAPQLQMQGASIVLVGSFGPATFQPAWFATHGVIRPQEADAAQIQIIHSDLADFTTEWLHVQVTPQRFAADTDQESYYEPLRDLVLSVLDLTHAPVARMGLNRVFHYPLASEKRWHSLGHRLAPKRDWKPYLKDPGLEALIIRAARADKRDGVVRVRVEPSARVDYGVFIEVNDHYELAKADPPASTTEEAAQILADHWGESLERALQLAEHIASLEAGQ
jgi:hypothetical protein